MALCFFSVLVLLTAVLARPSEDVSAACSVLATRYPAHLAWDPLGAHSNQSLGMAAIYNDTNGGYWNVQNSKYRAACAFVPESAEQVSAAVHVLNQYPAAQFALKSGGHQPALGFSSTDGGILISFRPFLNNTVRSEDGKHFIVGVGARWGEVYAVAQQSNEVVVGGRLGHIGVGGFVLGGGLSYYSAQYGLACDNADVFEAVLANGTVVHASADSHSDLWWSLRGGGNQFAIVTRMWLQAHPLGDDGQVWGGIRSYTEGKKDALFKAMANFVRDYPDTKAAMIPTFQAGLPGNLLNVVTGPTLFYFYDGAKPPAGVFDEFDAIDSLSDNTGPTSYTNLTSLSGGGAPLPGFGASFRVTTFPNMPTDDMVDFYNEYHQQNYWASLMSGFDLGIHLMTMAPQPMPVAIANASQARWGNTLGLDPSHGDRVWIENSMIWSSDTCNEKCPAASKQVTSSTLQYHKEHYAGVPPTNYRQGDLDFISYNPLFLNDAGPDEDVYSSYGETNLARLRSIKHAYDPSGFFTKRQGGFKLS